ncbi:response regulator [Leptolyngbya sp. KIOST-1]|uniref:response regulator n=1 Tax=Leptolyngbya sp. KIOST-1 TaxID=1229172 RepID=UPI00055B1C95|nr:response regulator [Leptolyngbya sp. KIOST-1]
MSSESQIAFNPGILKDVRILIVDNDADSRYLYKVLFEIYGALVTETESIASAMTFLEWLTPDIVICEVRFFEEDVLLLIQKIKILALGRDRTIPVLIVSAYCAAKFAQSLLTMVEDYLPKPIDIDHLVDEVWNLVHLSKSTRKVNIQDWVEKRKVWTKQRAIATMLSYSGA